MGKVMNVGDRIAVLSAENPFAENTSDHALFAIARTGQTGNSFTRAVLASEAARAVWDSLAAEGEESGAVALVLALQRWADLGLIALVPAVAPRVESPAFKLSAKATFGLARSAGAR